MAVDISEELLQQLCHDLRLLWTLAGGPSLRILSTHVRLEKSQVGAILNGRIRRLPDWDVVRGLLNSFQQYAQEHNRAADTTLSAGVDQVWRARYNMVEYAFSQDAHRQRRLASATDPSARPAAARRIRNGLEEAEQSLGFRDGSVPVRWQLASGAVTPRQLPPTVPCFAGRAAELEILTRPCDQRADGCTAMPISAISGMAGVGKTALALTWAHRMADRFPDGQLYVNLRGSDQFRVPMSPDEAVCGFLEALHVPPQEIPGSMAAKVGLYRSVLYGKRVLVVLDHARDSEQVRSLLPGAPGCLVVVTSRNHLSGLIATHGAQPLILEPLSRPEARKLLGSRLSPERFAGERFAIEDVISQCEGLPQKLAIVAARAAASPQLSLPALAAQLRQDQGGPEPKISTAGN